MELICYVLFPGFAHIASYLQTIASPAPVCDRDSPKPQQIPLEWEIIPYRSKADEPPVYLNLLKNFVVNLDDLRVFQASSAA